MSYILLGDLQLISLCNFDPKSASDCSELPSQSENVHQLFFTLQDSKDDILYVSEVAIAYTGLEFGVLLLPRLANRLHQATIRIYMKPLYAANWTLFYMLKIDIRNLVNVGKLEDSDHTAMFVPNTILWRFHELCYCLRPDLLDISALDRARAISWSRPRALKKSYNLDNIRQLSSLHIGVTEFAELKLKLSDQIESEFMKLQKISDWNSDNIVRSLKFDLHTLHKFVVKQNSANDALHLDVYQRKLQIGRSKQLVEEEFPHFEGICTEKIEIAQSQIEPLHELLNNSVYPELIVGLREIGSVIRDTFPIESSESGRHSICGISFPLRVQELLDFCYYGVNADSDPETQSLSVDKINTGLSYIVQLILTLAGLMNITLKYHMETGGPGSYLVDFLSPQQLSHTDQKQTSELHSTIKITFPLYYSEDQTQKFTSYETPERNFTMKNPRFEQGLNLLNKNLVMLIGAITDAYSQYFHDNVANHLISNNIPVDCLDNFLWNLDYLLLFMTAHEK